MIAKTSSRSGFGGALRYITDPEKGEILALRNLTGTTASALAARMETVASASRAKKPGWHLIVSWDPTDTPTHDEMRMAAVRLLTRLGLAEHQAVVAAHHDRPHAHMHIVVNRVHPNHGQERADGTRYQAWRDWKVYPVIERELRALEREYGWRRVPGDQHLEPGVAHPKFSPGGRVRQPTTGDGAAGPAPDPERLPQTARALVACHRAAAQGSAEDQYRTGALFELGMGVPGDADKAGYWYAQAARNGHSAAQSAYARCEQAYGPLRWPQGLTARHAWGLGPVRKRRGGLGLARRREDEDEDDFGLGL